MTFVSTRNGRSLRNYILIAAAALTLGAGLAAEPRPRAVPGSGSGGLFVADKGKFRIAVNGQPIGSEEFEIHPNGDRWLAQGNVEIHSAQGGLTHIHSHLTLQPDGEPVHYDWSTDGEKTASAEIQFQSSVATIVLQLPNKKPFTQQFTFTSPLVAVLDNNLYHQYGILARLYDRSKSGQQTFSVLVPQELTPGSVTVESLGPSAVAGSEKLEELRVQTSDLEVDLYLDGKGRLMRLVAPSSNAEVVRE
ncbi:MAG: hypothetical protein WCA98_07885 [Candidatus Acidiferrales bacterium]